MAERIQVELVDDMDGSPAQQTVTFALDGVTYEIDLSEQHAHRLRTLLARYIERARVPERERERERPAAPTKRQEREEREARQANRQLTEQIRGAAQRTRERLSKQQEPGSGDQDPGNEAPKPLPAAAAESVKPLEDSKADGRGAEHENDQQQNPVPAVSLPQFSSAVD